MTDGSRRSVENTTRGLWVKLSVNYFDDDRIMEAGVEPELLFVRGLAWAKRDNSGVITRGAMIRLGLGLVDAHYCAERLVELGLWEHADGAYRIVNWSQWQVDSEVISKRREASSLGNHRRWHKQKPVDGCPHCDADKLDLFEYRKSIASATDLGVPEKEKEIEINNTQSSDDKFDLFWNEYPRKVSKVDAMKAWKQTAKQRPSHDELMVLLNEAKKSWKASNTELRFIPHPSTWLRQQRWSDVEVASVPTASLRPCGACFGRGLVDYGSPEGKEPCRACGGAGRVSEKP